MLSDKTVDEIIDIVGTKRETKLCDMFKALDLCGIKYSSQRVEVDNKEQLPSVCFLSLETPRCWHWSLYFHGRFYDPEHGESDDFPKAYRKYYWQIFT